MRVYSSQNLFSYLISANHGVLLIEDALAITRLKNKICSFSNLIHQTGNLQADSRIL
jgi:hypothetical protein